MVVRVPDNTPRSPGFDSRRYQTFYTAEVLERGQFNLVSINEELLEREISDSGIENRD
jgi:hypothetical protein